MYRYLVTAMLLTYAILGIINIYFGRLTSDEGWYLYVSNVVYSGTIPYRDFLFTQMPFVPYIYGLILNIVTPSLVVGRWLSFVFGLLSVAVILSTFRVDKRAAAFAGLLLTMNLNFVFDTTILKTQALTVFLTAVSMYFLSSRHNRPLLGLFFLNLTVFTRLSMLPALVLCWVYVVVTNRGHLKRNLFIATGNAVLGMLILVVLNRYTDGNFRFGVYTFHDAYFPNAEWSTQTLVRFVVSVFKNQALITSATLILGIVSCVKVIRLPYNDWQNKAQLFPVFAFLCWLTTTIVHATRTIPYATYQTSNIIFAVATISPLLSSAVDGVVVRTRLAFVSIFLLLLISMPFQEYDIRLDGDGSVQQYEAAVHRIQTLKTSEARTILTFNPELAASSGLKLLPGYEMGAFSYFSRFDDCKSLKLKVKNSNGFAQDIENRSADVIALTGGNIILMLSNGDMTRAKRLFAWLQNGYRLEQRIRDYGQYSDTLYIYKKR